MSDPDHCYHLICHGLLFSVPMDDQSSVSSLVELLNDESESLSLFTESKYYSISDLKAIPNFVRYDQNITVFNSNARSLLKHEIEYKSLFDSLSRADMHFNIITFCETWMDTNLESLISFDGYSAVYRHKNNIKEGGGIAAFIKSHINFKVRDDLNFTDEVLDKFDGLFIELVTSKKAQNIILCILYRSPSYNSIREFTTHLLHKVDLIHKEGKSILITGDLNIDLLKYQSNPNTASFLDNMIVKNLIPKITKPTRKTETSATLIDHIFTNIENTFCLAGTLLTDISDHYSNFISIKFKSQQKLFPQTYTYRAITQTSLANLNNSMQEHDWNDIYNASDVNIAYELFEKQLSRLLNTHLPIVSKKFNRHRHKYQPWITKGILRSLKQKEKLYIHMLKAKNTPSFSVKEQKYKRYNSVYNKCVKAAKNIHWKNTFETTKHDMKKTWENINKLINRNSKHISQSNSFSDDKQEYNTPTEIANGFNKYFTNIGPSLSKNIPSSHIKAVDFLSNRTTLNSLYLYPATPPEIAKIIKLMKPKTSTGHDNISPKVLKSIDDTIALPLTHIANLSMSTGIFPNRMKIAKVITIYKSDDTTLFKNYRPISILPTFSKILERLVYNRLYKFLKTHSLLSNSQYGFIKNLSTEQAILELQDSVVKSLAKKHYTIGIFLDLTKAFDSLDHSILISKLYHLGIRGLALNWFQNYLSNRKQFTSYLNATSNSEIITHGVPQGSILGPLLFLIYINDLPDNLVNSKAILYADDTNLIFHDKDLKKLITSINSELPKVQSWFSANKLTLNTKKTHSIIFHNRQQAIPTDEIILKFGNNTIQQKSDMKFLGIYLDKNLNWKKHITYKCNQILKVNYLLSKLKHTISTDILTTIYNSLILPHITYAITSWGNMKNKEMDRLEKLQKKAIRFVNKSKYNSHTDPLFKQSKLLKLQDIYNIECIKIYLRHKAQILSPYLSNQLATNAEIHTHHTRQDQDIHNTPITSTLEEQLVNSKIAAAWNKLPHNIKTLGSPSTDTLKNHFISKYKDSCNIINCPNCKR